MIAEAFETGSIIVVDKLAEEGVPIGVVGECAAGAATFFLATNGFGDAAIEALDQAVSLRMVRLCQAMVYAVLLAEPIKGMIAGRLPGRFVLLVDGEAVGELGAVVGQDGVNFVREVSEKALEEAGCGLAVSSGMDLDIDVAGGTIDRDEGITSAALQGRQMLQVEMDKSNAGGLEDARLWLLRFGTTADAVALQAPVNGTTGQLGIDAALHHLDDVVQWQLQRGP